MQVVFRLECPTIIPEWFHAKSFVSEFHTIVPEGRVISWEIETNGEWLGINFDGIIFGRMIRTSGKNRSQSDLFNSFYQLINFFFIIIMLL